MALSKRARSNAARWRWRGYCARCSHVGARDGFSGWCFLLVYRNRSQRKWNPLRTPNRQFRVL